MRIIAPRGAIIRIHTIEKCIFTLCTSPCPLGPPSHWLGKSLGAPSPEQGTGNREMDTSPVIRSVPNEDSTLARVALCLRGEQPLGRLAVGGGLLLGVAATYVSALGGRPRKRPTGWVDSAQHAVVLND